MRITLGWSLSWRRRIVYMVKYRTCASTDVRGVYRNIAWDFVFGFGLPLGLFLRKQGAKMIADRR